MNELKVGDKVRTTNAYFEQVNRKVYGVLQETNGRKICVVHVQRQEGERAIPELINNRLMMRREDLEKDDDK